MGELRTRFLTDGGQPSSEVAGELSGFIGEAKRSLDVAIYDFHARAGASATVADSLEAAHARGVAIRVAFNVERVESPAAPRPMESDPDQIDGLAVPTKGVHDQGSLMHHKYVVRDSGSVWTGSTNWTDDAFSREENVILTVDSREIATAYEANFDKLWGRGRLGRTGAVGTPVTLDHGVRVTPAFLPSPPSAAQLVASRVATADRRIRIVSPVVTSGAVLGTVAEFAGRRRVELGGAYDRTQMEEVQRQWATVPWNRWKIEAWQAIAPHLSGKVSTPYAPGSVHDYMHAKFVVVDDEVIAGSWNLSHGGEDNAENLLHILSEFLAVRFTEFADVVSARYRSSA
jgi:phosphatidylserine/phosphatidylglycerophosphate/cardiolipin synthase-like enzyme